jgi:hypothetical protein
MTLATDLVSPKTAVRRAPAHRVVNRAWERVFFGGMAALLCVAVVLGFGHAYFFAGMMRAPLPNRLVHVHAAVFTLWMILYVAQTALVAAKRVKWHRTLGLAAFCLPLVMVPLGVVTALDELRRETTPFTGVVPRMSAIFFAESLLGIGLFAVVILASWRTRRRPDAHKRLALYATIGLASGALIRIPWAKIGLGANAYLWALALMLGLVVAYDLAALRRVHRSSLWAAPLTFAAIALTEPIAASGWWQGFAGFLAAHVAPHL